MSFSENLHNAMADKKISQMELAEATGSNQTCISRYVTGKREPKASALKNIAVALDVSADQLLGIGEYDGTD